MKYLQLKTGRPFILSRPVSCQPTTWELTCLRVMWHRKCCVAIYSQLFLFCLEEIKKNLRVWNRNLIVISDVNEGYELVDEIFVWCYVRNLTTNFVRTLSVHDN